MRLLELGSEPDLAREPLGADPLGQLGGEHLHDDGAAQRLVASHEHARHSAAAQLPLERVRRAERALKLFAQLIRGHGRTRSHQGKSKCRSAQIPAATRATQ